MDVLGEGSFGCVVRPTVPCTNKKHHIADTKSEVSKLFASVEDFEAEVKTAKVISKIDPKGKVMLTPSAYCKTSFSSFPNPMALLRCSAFNDHPTDEPIYQLMMPYGGMRLDHYVSHMTLSVKQFLSLMLPVAEGIRMLEKKKYCHQDIKVSNILVTPEHRAMLIDYSLMKRFRDIYTPGNKHYLRHTYFSYPPEYKAVYYKDAGKDKIIQEVLANISLYDKKYRKRFLQAWGKQTQPKWVFNDVATLEKHTNTIDVYSLGTVFVRLTEHIQKEGMSKEIKKAFVDLVNKMIAVDPAKRIRPTELVEEIKNIIDM